MRVCLVANELLGAFKNGGIGTSTSFLGFALADMGHDVEVLYFGTTASVDAVWADRYASSGISVRFLKPPAHQIRFDYLRTSEAIYTELKDRDFDAIVFQDTSGPGFCSMRAKQLGLAFQETTLVVYAHSPTAWIAEANRRFPIGRWDLAFDSMERHSAELSDAVVSPSEHMVSWMTKSGWHLPKATEVVPYFSAGTTRPDWLTAEPSQDQTSIIEIAFFGRLEERKGVKVFVEALNRLEDAALEGRSVSFIGKPAGWTPREIRKRISSRVLSHLNEISFRTRLSHDDALTFLQQPGVLAVMPSLMDNSPCVIYECLERGIRFLASSEGGGRELISPEDRPALTFQPEPKALAGALEAALARSAWPQFDLRHSTEHLNQAWSRVLSSGRRPPMLSNPVFASVVITHFERPAQLSRCLRALAQQTSDQFEVIIVDDGSASEHSKSALAEIESRSWPWDLRILRRSNGYVGAARNSGWKDAKGEVVIFLDDDNIPLPEYVEILVRSWSWSGVDVVSCGLDLFKEQGSDRPERSQMFSQLFIGEPGALGVIENQFGDASSLWPKRVLESLGGFHEVAGVTFEDWDLFARANLEGFRVASVPQPLVWYSVSNDGMLRTRDVYATRRILVDTFAGHLPKSLTGLPAMTHLIYNDLPVSDRLDGVWIGEAGWKRYRNLAYAFAMTTRREGVGSALSKAKRFFTKL